MDVNGVERIADAELGLHRSKVCTALELFVVPFAEIDRLLAATPHHVRVVGEIGANAARLAGALLAALPDRVIGLAAEVCDFRQNLFHCEIVIEAPQSAHNKKHNSSILLAER